MFQAIDALVSSMMWAVIVLVGIWLIGQIVLLMSNGR